MIKSLAIIAFFLQACKPVGKEVEIQILHPELEKEIVIPLDTIQHTVQSIEIIENTLNDTCKIGIVDVLPKFTGVLYKTEDYSTDTIKYTYYPYKAKTGVLIFKHKFY